VTLATYLAEPVDIAEAAACFICVCAIFGAMCALEGIRVGVGRFIQWRRRRREAAEGARRRAER